MNSELLKRIQKQAKQRLLLREDPRYIRTVEVLQFYGLLYTSHPIDKLSRNMRITFEEAYFAGNLEPRIFEVLPALVYRRPKAILNAWAIPSDLKEVIDQIRKGNPVQTFHGISPKNYMIWVERLKRKSSQERIFRRDFRFSKEDIDQLENLQKKLKLQSQTEVIRQAIRSLLAN